MGRQPGAPAWGVPVNTGAEGRFWKARQPALHQVDSPAAPGAHYEEPLAPLGHLVVRGPQPEEAELKPALLQALPPAPESIPVDEGRDVLHHHGLGARFLHALHHGIRSGAENVMQFAHVRVALPRGPAVVAVSLAGRAGEQEPVAGEISPVPAAHIREQVARFGMVPAVHVHPPSPVVLSVHHPRAGQPGTQAHAAEASEEIYRFHGGLYPCSTMRLGSGFPCSSNGWAWTPGQVQPGTLQSSVIEL